MPQLMPIFWELSVFIMIMLVLVLVEVYFYLNKFDLEQKEVNSSVISVNMLYLW